MIIEPTKKRFLVIWLVIPIIGMAVFPFIHNNSYFLKIVTSALIINILFFSIVMHELAHGIVALLCGDNTAQNSGRITFNPMHHISIFGTLFIPIIMFILKAPMVFGWAKPIPFNPMKLKRHPRDQVALIMAGPLMNFASSIVFFIIFGICHCIYISLYPHAHSDVALTILDPITLINGPFTGFWFILFKTCLLGIIINITLGGFNLIPIPPLDGFWILKALIPKKFVIIFSRIQNYGFIIIIIAIQSNVLDALFYPVNILKGFFQILLRWML